MTLSWPATAIRRGVPVAAPPEQRAQLQALLKALEGMAPEPNDTAACQLIGPGNKRIPLPESVFHALEQVVEVLARGDSITIVPIGQQVTTQQAANILNVSRQYLVRLLNEERIPYFKAGKHRRLRIADVLKFKEQRDRERRSALRDLSQLSQEMGGYEDD